MATGGWNTPLEGKPVDLEVVRVAAEPETVLEASEWTGGNQLLVAGDAAPGQSKRKLAVVITARCRINKGGVYYC